MSWSASATLGRGTPSALPISRARPRSFLHMSTLNSASAGMPSTNGPRYLTIGEAMTDLSKTSTARSRAIPAFSASATASLNASICTARLRFVATFIVTASPSSPTWVIVGPIARRWPRTFSSAAGSPPTMNESWPASTVTALPDTGATLGDQAPQLARDVGTHRAHLRPDGARPQPGDHAVGAERDRAQRGAIRHHAQDGVRGLRDGARRLLEHEAGLDQRASFLGGPVVADDLAPRRQEPLGHAAAHRAEPDEAHRRHQLPASSTTAIALISSLHRAWVASRETSTVVVVGRWPPR